MKNTNIRYKLVNKLIDYIIHNVMRAVDNQVVMAI